MASKRHKARWTTGQHIRIPFNVLESEAWRSLPHSAMALYLHVRHSFNGHNNGNIAVTFSAAKSIGLFRSKCAFYRALDALWQCGFIAMVREGDWGADRKCHLWALTTDPVDQNPKLGIAAGPRTDYWKTWRPGKPSSDYVKKSPMILRKREFASQRATERKTISCVPKSDRDASGIRTREATVGGTMRPLSGPVGTKSAPRTRPETEPLFNLPGWVP